MPLTNREQVERIELSTPGEWAEMRANLSVGDRTQLRGAAMAHLRVSRALLGGAGAAGDIQLAPKSYDAMIFTGLEVGIVGWSFDVPVTPENIRCLTEEDYDILAEATNRLWPERSEEERKNSG